jgi:acyl-CoA dehydrogenase
LVSRISDSLLTHRLDETTTDVRVATEEILKRYGRPYVLECLAQDRFPQELMSALGSSGLLGLGVPEEHGGSGGGTVEQCCLAETMGRAGIPAALFLIANFTRNLVLRFGTDKQIADFLPASLTGEARYSFALTEADAGTNSFAIRTSAVRDGDAWIINGSKAFISWIGVASKALLVARTSKYDPSNRTSGLAIFAVDLPTPGLEAHPMRIDQGDFDKQYIVTLDDVRLPTDALIGEAHAGFSYIFDALNPERALASSMAVGLGTFLLEKAVSYAQTRAPFGSPIGTYQGVQHPLARSFASLRAARSLIYEAAEAIDAGRPAGVLANSAKFLASEAANAAFDAAMQTHGGYAFDEDYDVVTFYRRIRGSRIAPLNNEMILNFLAERALGLPAGR